MILQDSTPRRVQQHRCPTTTSAGTGTRTPFGVTFGEISTIRQRSNLKLFSLVLLTLGWAVAARPVHAQTGRAEAHRAGFQTQAGLRGTRVSGNTSTMLGGDVRISVRPDLAVGGAGWLLNNSRAVEAGSGDTGLLLDVSYGGLLVEQRLFGAEAGGTLHVRLTAGAGNAKVTLAGVGTEIAADNFGVLEPEIALGWRLHRLLTLRSQIGYRLVFGVDDLPQVEASDVGGPSLTLGVTLGSLRGRSSG